MKRFLCILVVLCLLPGLSSCTFANRSDSNVDFYYLQFDFNNFDPTSISYGEADSIIGSESRNAEGHMNDLNYMLLLYLRGPASKSLYAPFPASTQLSAVEKKEDVLYVTLSGISLTEQSDLRISLACACLTKTCLELTDVSTVHINTEAGILAGEDDIIMTEASLVFLDVSSTTPDETDSE